MLIFVEQKQRKREIMKTIYKALSTEKGNEGKTLGFSKRPSVVDGKLQPVYLTYDEFEIVQI